MIKKLHKDLLENYPLLWNLRLPGVFGALAIFHLIHFLVGYSMYSGEESTRWHNPEGMYFSTSFCLFSMIGSSVIFILWLIRVFRNNAFKSFYPIGNGKLFQEFMVFFVVCLLNITCYYSYTFGFVFHARNNTNNSENKKDIEVYNSVIAFLQNNKDAYRLEGRCYPDPFPLTKRYNENVRYAPSDQVPKSDYYFVSRDGRKFSSAEVDVLTGGVEYSYLNNCNFYSMYIHNESDRYSSNSEQENEHYKTRLVKTLNNPEELKANMAAFIKLCDKHNISYQLEVDDWFKWVYNPPYFPVNYLIFHKYYYPGQYPTPNLSDASVIQASLQLNPKGYFVEVSKLQNILQSTQRAYDYSFELAPFLGFLYAALFMSIMIFTFRATARRTWMIALIGSALICLIIGALTAVLAFGGGKDGILYFYLLVILSFILIHFISIRKTVSGVSLIWFVWSLPYAFVILLGLLENNFDKDYFQTYFLVCLFIYLMTLRFFLVPRFRAWQAMPEN